MTPHPIRFAAIALAIAGMGAVAGCSSSSSGSGGSTTGGAPTGAGSSTAAASASAGAPSTDPAQAYVDQVNALCDALLPKVLKVIHGGHPGVYPVRVFRAELPAHSALEKDFDRQLAQIPVPAAAKALAKAMHDYIAFANHIDRARLAAANKGQAAFDKEIRAENDEFPNDPIAAARDAAGFNDSCNAR